MAHHLAKEQKYFQTMRFCSNRVVLASLLEREPAADLHVIQISLGNIYPSILEFPGHAIKNRQILLTVLFCLMALTLTFRQDIATIMQLYVETRI